MAKKINNFNYRVRFLCDGDNSFKSIPHYELAEHSRPDRPLKQSCRVIAKLNSQRYPHFNGFYAGIIGDTIKRSNNFQYFVFFDNGRVDYVDPRDVRLVRDDCGWSHVHPNAMEFIRYILYEKHIFLINESIGKKIKVEHDGKWLFAKITNEVGTLLIQVTYEETNCTEWLFRGSLRFSSGWRFYNKSRLDSSTTEVELLSSSDEDAEDCENPSNSILLPATAAGKRDDRPVVKRLEVEKLDEYRKPRSYVRHKCGRACHPAVNDLTAFGPLARPLIIGWRRTFKRKIVYSTPCGREIKTEYELRSYLVDVRCHGFDVDNFSFEREVDCLRQYDRMDANSLITEVNTFCHFSLLLSCCSVLIFLSLSRCICRTFRMVSSGRRSASSMHSRSKCRITSNT